MSRSDAAPRDTDAAPIRRRRRTMAAQASAGDREGTLDGLFRSMRDQASRDLGDEVLIGLDPERLMVALPLPALCLRYLFQSTGLPLSRIIQITGEEGCCKSSLMYEMMRWHMTHGGGAVYIENENKDSAPMRHSILEWNPHWLNRLEFRQTYDLEGWQDTLTCFLGIAKAQQDGSGGPGRTIPILFGLDSIMGTSPRDELKAVQDAGHTQRGHPLAAMLITRYMRAMPFLLMKYPFTIVGTNHLKPSTDYMGRPTNTKPGGMAVKFMETFEIEMHRAPNADIDLLDYGGLRLKIVLRKNSIGPSRRAIAVELLWWQGAVGDEVKQQTAWDWNTSTIELLLSFETAKGKKTLYNRLMDVVGLVVSNKSKREVWSDVLGIPRASPVHYRQAGALLEQRQDLLEQLYPILGITPRYPFIPGMDYRQALLQAREAGQVAAAPVYAQSPNMPIIDPDLLDPTGATIPPEVEPDGSEDE